MDHAVVLVTGGSRGIGAAVARSAAVAGWAVCLTYRDDEAAASGVVAEIESAGGVAAAVRADVAVEADVLALSRLPTASVRSPPWWPTPALSRPRPGSTS